jgi:hypothetical protein
VSPEIHGNANSGDEDKRTREEETSPYLWDFLDRVAASRWSEGIV